MKEMIYQKDPCKEILLQGEYKGHKFTILSLGCHPTAYVECKLAGCNSYGDERLDEVDVHGGFTYLNVAHWDKDDKTLYLGWDYGHYSDFSGIYLRPEMLVDLYHMKRWTTAEIYEEVKSVIDQLVEIERSEGSEEVV